MRIAIVNDEIVAVEMLRRVVVATPGGVVAWVAHDGAEAVRRCAIDLPDLVLMDLLMPVMDGVEATRQIMIASPCPIIIVTGDVTRNTSRVFAAMGAGALDVAATPAARGGADGPSTSALRGKIRVVGQLMAPRASPGALRGADATAVGVPRTLSGLVAIGASAGGPPAVAQVLRDLPRDMQIAVLVVQHVDPEFVDSMADWLDGQSALTVRVAAEGDVPEAGHAYLAGGGLHLVLRDDGRLGYASAPHDAPYRPSADVLFASVASHWRGAAAGVVLSGMGCDGAIGLGKLRARGARTIAQDQATSAVYGMPRAAVEANAATDVLPLASIGALLRMLFRPPGNAPPTVAPTAAPAGAASR